MGKDYQVSIIIINYNTPKLLRDCILSVDSLTQNLSYEIIVVDNASDENLTELFHKEFPHVRFISSSVNLGFGKANNMGVEQAKGEYLFFLNSDTILLNNAIFELHSFIKSHPNVGICGGNLYDGDQRPSHSYYKMPSVRDEWSIFFSIKKGVSHMHNFDSCEKSVGYICGADLMIGKQLFTDLGGFDPDFFLYYEETEMTYRCRQRGYGIYSVPQAKIIHYQGMSAMKEEDDLKDKTKQEFLYSKFLYYKKTGNPSAPLYIKRLYMLRSFLSISLFGVLGKKKKVAYWQQSRKMVCKAYKRYFAFATLRNS